jgi:hypothetical protein
MVRLSYGVVTDSGAVGCDASEFTDQERPRAVSNRSRRIGASVLE